MSETGEENTPSLTYEAMAALLHLSGLRSQFRIGLALMERFQTYEAFEAWTSQPEVIETMNCLAEIVNDITRNLGSTPEDVATAVSHHYERLAEVVEPLAEDLQVDPEDLLNVLSNA